MTTDSASLAKQIQVHVRDLLKPNPWIFWLDMLCCAALAHTGLLIYLTQPASSPWMWVGGAVGLLAYYRGLMFIHEIAHFKRKSFRGFRFCWNVLLGMPMMTPSFLYAEHRTHHVNETYGTHGDAEYYPIGRGPVGLIVWFISQGLLMPGLAIMRFAILAPISILHPALRRWVWQRASGLTQNNPHFRRPWPEGSQWLWWSLQEAGCTLICWTILVLIWQGTIPAFWLAKGYALFGLMTTLSYVRALGSHLYWNEGDPMAYADQMLDSTTIPGHPLLTELWAPLGQRYHALHHLVPSIPYHSLGIAHRRLMQALPDDSPYRLTIRDSLWTILKEIWHRADQEASRRTTWTTIT